MGALSVEIDEFGMVAVIAFTELLFFVFHCAVECNAMRLGAVLVAAPHLLAF